MKERLTPSFVEAISDLCHNLACCRQVLSSRSSAARRLMDLRAKVMGPPELVRIPDTLGRL